MLSLIERHEAALNSLLGLVAIIIAIVSLCFSTKANRAAEHANQINEEGVRLSKRTVESRKTITLKAEITGDPPILNLTPVSNDFVLSDSLVFYPCAEEGCPMLCMNSNVPGMHDLSKVVAVITGAVKQRDKQRYVDSEEWISEQWLPEAFPIMVRVDYVFEGEPIELHLLYIIVYRDPSSMGLNQHNDEPGPVEHAVRLQRAYFAGQMTGRDDAEQVLQKEYRYWRRFLDLNPEFLDFDKDDF